MMKCVHGTRAIYFASHESCEICGKPESVNVALKEYFETTMEHVPGRPTFRSRREQARYFKAHGLVALGKSDISWMKRQAERSRGYLPPKRDLKAWWHKEAAKYRGLVDRPALISR